MVSMRRSSVLFLSVLRQIRNTLGRYLAIFAIIALGVGFFAGLRVSTDAMLETADKYLREKKLYDFRLISTLGLTGEDVEAFAGLEGVEMAVGSVCADCLCMSSGGDAVFRAHLLTEEMNRLDLVAGRLPGAGDECVLDATYFGEESLGTVLRFSGENSEDTFGTFAYDAYTVVGLVNAPYYANFERGTTALGQGKLSGFICLPAEGFDTELYTEIFLTLEDGGALYSDEYEAAVDGMEGAVSALLEERATRRYDGLRSDALSGIADAQAELDEGRETYRSERADAEKELAAALEELTTARRDLDEGREQLTDGKEELSSQKAEAERRFADARRELDNGWAELEKGKTELAARREEAQQGFAAAQAELDEAAEQIAEGEMQLEQCRSLCAAGNALVLGINGAGFGMQYASPGELIADLSSGANPMLTAVVDNALADYDMTADSLCAAWDRAEQALGAPLSEETVAALSEELAAAREKYGEGAAQLDEAKNAAETAFAEAEGQIVSSETQLTAGETEYAESRRAAYDAIAEAEREIADSERKLADGETDYAAGLREYEDAKAEAERQFAEAEQALADGQREVDEARKELEALEPPSTYVLDRSANIGCATLDNDMGIVRGVSRVFPLFFFLVAALVCVTTMTRMVDEQRTQNGVLKALGYGSGAIVGQYLFYAGSASALGCIAGFLLGSRFLPMALWRVYRIMYAIDRPVAFILDWKLFAACTALFLLCSLGATWLVCRRDLKESAAELIRPKAPPAGKRILIERVKFLWKRVKFLHKVSIRNILRYKKRMVMMILGVGGCTALLLTGFGIRDSIQHILDYQYDEIEIYDCSVSFTKALNASDAEAFRTAHAEELSDAVFLHASAMDLTAGGKTLSVNTVVFEEEPEGFIDLHRGEEHLPWPEIGETVIDYRLAMDCGLKTGDTVTLRDPELREVTLTVAGIFDNYIYDYAFIRADTFREQWGTAPEVKSAYLRLAEGADRHAAAAAIVNDGNVAAVNLLADMAERVGSMLASMNYVVLIVLVCAGALAFIVLYNLTNISIGERRREIATLKVLGFYPAESAAYVFRENMVLTGISALAGLPMGYALLWYVMRQIKIGSFYFGCRAAPMSYVLSVALTFAFAAAVAFLLYFKLEKIDMADSLKAIE
ncbi:MAG: ABC transporter permease [Oscillospiraceae bacterium]|nr:ABC transporter permease [Oscillospiraceae bacterium]